MRYSLAFVTREEAEMTASSSPTPTEAAQSPRVPPVPREDVTDTELREVLDRSDRLSTPKPAWYLALAHNPEVAKGFARFWETTYREGRVDHVVKELMRMAIVQLSGCDFCGSQRSVRALEEGLQEDDVQACAMPEFDHPDPRTHAAVRFARAIALDHAGADTAQYDELYAELRAVYDDEEVIELVSFAGLALGGTKVARSLGLL
jgi:alkylhydroperoxidase family enzyme